MRSIIDLIITPVLTFITQISDKLDLVNVRIASGINLSQALQIFSGTPHSIRYFIVVLSGSLLSIGLIYLVKNSLGLFKQLKEIIHWW